MKILYVIDSLGPGGAERSLSEMLPRLRRADVDTVVSCLEDWNEDHASAVDSVARVITVTRKRRLAQTLQLRKIIRAERPDIVHTSLFKSDVVGRLAAWRTGATVLTSLVNTSYEPERLRDPNVNARKLQLVRVVDGFTARHLTHHFHAISEAVADSAVRRLGIDREKISVIPRGRDRGRLGEVSPARRERVREQLDLPANAPVVLNVGRQDYQKGHLDLLHAFEQVHRRHPQAHLLLAGRRGHATRAMEEFLASARSASHVRLLGHREDVPDLLAAADIFVFPSHYEGLGGSVLEAMALGLPLVVTRVPALLEATEEGGNAIAVPIGQPAELAEGLSTLLDDPDLRRCYGRRSSEIFAERFELESCMRRMLEMYTHLVAGPSVPVNAKGAPPPTND